MEKHQEVQLNCFLDQLYLEGATFIRWDQMYLWYRVDRITKAPWRDITGRWEELCKREGWTKKAPALFGLFEEGIPGVSITREAFPDGKVQPLSELTS